MRFLMLYRPERSPETSGPPTPEQMATMGSYIEEQFRSGVLVATGGLHPSSRGARVRVSRGKVTVTEGPLPPADKVISGFAIVKAGSDAEAIELAKRFLAIAGDGESEVRAMYEPSQYMMVYRPDADAESGRRPSEDEMAAMGAFVAEMTKAGVLLATGGLLPSSMGARARLSGGQRTVTDGPFTEAKELIAGYAIVELSSKEAAIESAWRFLTLAGDGTSEIRAMAT